MAIYAVYGRKVGNGVNLKISPPNAKYKPMARCKLYGTLLANSIPEATTKLDTMVKLALDTRVKLALR